MSCRRCTSWSQAATYQQLRRNIRSDIHSVQCRIVRVNHRRNKSATDPRLSDRVWTGLRRVNSRWIIECTYHVH